MVIAIYARVSTDQQAEKGYSLGTQLAACKKKAAELSLGNRIEEFVDNGYSGAYLERPALEKLRRGLRQRRFSAVVVYDPDRLARNLTHQLILTDEIENSGARLVFVNFAWQNTPEGKLFYSIRGAVSAYEREKIKERSQRGKRGKALAGKVVRNIRPYGYDWDETNSMYVINEAEARMIRQIFSWVVDNRLGVRAIAAKLTRMNFPTRSGKKNWNIGTVHDIIKREAYAGIHWANREYKTKTGQNKTLRGVRDRSEWIPVSVPPIVSREIWEAAQRQLQQNKRSAKQPLTYHYLCRNLVVCPLCGEYMRTATSGSRRKPYYVCKTGRAISGKAAGPASRKCPARQVPAEELDQHLWRYISGLLADPSLLAAELSRQAFSDDEILSLEENLAHLHTREEQLLQEQEKITLLFRQGLISLSLATEQLNEIKKALTAVHARRQQVTRELEAGRAAISEGLDIRGFSFLSADNDPDLKRQIISRVVKKIEALRTDNRSGPGTKADIAVKIYFAGEDRL